ncbi:P-loop containing nucleoside triphosphate hydrolase protein [Tothia fuscella]|uniref:P-loop containing nucleoside triphosphate hydrolase protein n=1 Tax=Tothia fuscella TaxID=1048955 RepID=A0A9P4TYL2_9PEZI|nr:P-loop containing nucleoside triphosphate hydrolase protein [Tothia fuscella]
MTSSLNAPHLAQNPFQSLRSGYNLTVYMLKDILGLDPAIVINISIFLAAISTVGRYVTAYLYHYLKMICLSSVRIDEDDALYRYFMKWINDNHLSKKSLRSVKANSVKKQTIDDEEEAFASIEKGFEKDELISYRTMMGRNPIRFAPHEESHVFYHKRNIFRFQHGYKAMPMLRSPIPQLKGELTIECLGRSLAPVKTLLEEAQTYYLEKTIATTQVFRGNGHHWGIINSRPSRDINTVILEKTKKQMLLADINEYLHPCTRRWYANHGIPYRRGYLFSGPPGCGKTSLTAALAGVFGIDIYVLSLLDPFMNEQVLIRLFSSVPSRCLVLLEDIDAAGLKRNDDPKLKKDAVADDGMGGVKPARGISLSGVLNAIDGVSSAEGRILVMTTNRPEDLDKALIRPGRVDMHVVFGLPGREEMVEMFESMYRDLVESLEMGKEATAVMAHLNLKDGKGKDKNGKQFADGIPAGKISLAAIQGFILRYKHDPRLAVEEVEGWVEETLRELESLDAK